MQRTVAIGTQDFKSLREKNYFYIDKTDFIQEWWESGDDVTLITRPRRFGKTLNLSMLDYFFSNHHAEEKRLFEGLSIWKDETYRTLQGTYPVISLSFANVKEENYQQTKKKIYQILIDLYARNAFLLETDVLQKKEQEYFERIGVDMDEADASIALHQLSKFLSRYYGKKVLIFLDEYDTPMQEAYVNGYWDELVSFTRSLFNSTFKTNPYMERAVLTGITRISKESIFSDFNNPKVVSTTSEEYRTSFGFTENEVFQALDEYGYGDRKEEVKHWYDGFVFGSQADIYNPWSILNYLDTGKFDTYWANTSSNSLVGKLLRESSQDIKESFETLLQDGVIESELDEQIVYDQLGENESAIWSLLLASGYLKVVNVDISEEEYQLKLTNYEVKKMFRSMVSGWFKAQQTNYNGFIKALLTCDKKAMNVYMNRVALNIFSYFDTGNRPSGAEPERFYHGFVLGLMVDLRKQYTITSNRESGFGRYDILLEPLHPEQDDAFIMEFKVHDAEEEQTLSDTAQAAIAQIAEKDYAAILREKGIPDERIHRYGFAFEGKKVLIDGA